jgi:hypothetical protein
VCRRFGACSGRTIPNGSTHAFACARSRTVRPDPSANAAGMGRRMRTRALPLPRVDKDINGRKREMRASASSSASSSTHDGKARDSAGGRVGGRSYLRRFRVQDGPSNRRVCAIAPPLLASLDCRSHVCEPTSLSQASAGVGSDPGQLRSMRLIARITTPTVRSEYRRAYFDVRNWLSLFHPL